MWGKAKSRDIRELTYEMNHKKCALLIQRSASPKKRSKKVHLWYS